MQAKYGKQYLKTVKHKGAIIRNRKSSWQVEIHWLKRRANPWRIAAGVPPRFVKDRFLGFARRFGRRNEEWMEEIAGSSARDGAPSHLFDGRVFSLPQPVLKSIRFPCYATMCI
jgi:hypothetical protein